MISFEMRPLLFVLLFAQMPPTCAPINLHSNLFSCVWLQIVRLNVLVDMLGKGSERIRFLHKAGQISEMKETHEHIVGEAQLALADVLSAVEALKSTLDPPPEDPTRLHQLAHHHGIILMLYDAVQTVSTRISHFGASTQPMGVQRFFAADPGKSFASGKSGVGGTGWGVSAESDPSERSWRRSENVNVNPNVDGSGGGRKSKDDSADASDDGNDFMKKENAMLLSELSTMDEEVERAETLLSEISSMNSFLTTKISEQGELVMELHRLAESATESIKLGRKELDKAMKRGVDFRMFVLLCLVMASLSLLFLDWYVG
eukprot:TRINITY_DN1259_c0_g1_i2.p1 TRINITY_DN1259_c0_g1~~TRINITY_DN1259_c0_g1_i2.p1  ORF type:complete len:317 (-),score=84.81 TRINITY_DN1259_c0_g1_i2:84-1034(-)